MVAADQTRRSELYDLIADAKEKYPQATIENTWVSGPARSIVARLQQGLRTFPLIAAGTPDPYSPPKE